MSTVIAPMIVIGCLKTSLPTVLKAICMTRVLFVMTDIKNPERALLKKSIELWSILLKS